MGTGNVSKEDLTEAAKVFYGSLGLDLVLSAVVAWMSYDSALLLRAVHAGLREIGDADIAMLNQRDAFASWSLLSMFVVGFVLLRWLKACYEHAHKRVGAAGFDHEDNVVWGWLIPFVNLFRPYQVMRELFQAGGNSYRNPQGWRNEVCSGWLLLWWIFWVSAHLMMLGIGRSLQNKMCRPDLTFDQVADALDTRAVLWGLSVAVSALWLVVSSSITGRLATKRPIEQAFASESQAEPQPVDVPSAERDPRHAAPSFADTQPSESAPLVPQSPARELVAQRSEESLWAAALDEVEGPHRRAGLWARLFAQADGNAEVAKARYLQERMREMLAQQST